MSEYKGEAEVSTAEAFTAEGGTNSNAVIGGTGTKAGSPAVKAGAGTEDVVAFVFQNEGAGALELLEVPLAEAKKKQGKEKSAKVNKKKELRHRW